MIKRVYNGSALLLKHLNWSAGFSMKNVRKDFRIFCLGLIIDGNSESIFTKIFFKFRAKESIQ